MSLDIAADVTQHCCWCHSTLLLMSLLPDEANQTDHTLSEHCLSKHPAATFRVWFGKYIACLLASAVLAQAWNRFTCRQTRGRQTGKGPVGLESMFTARQATNSKHMQCVLSLQSPNMFSFVAESTCIFWETNSKQMQWVLCFQFPDISLFSAGSTSLFKELISKLCQHISHVWSTGARTKLGGMYHQCRHISQVCFKQIPTHPSSISARCHPVISPLSAAAGVLLHACH